MSKQVHKFLAHARTAAMSTEGVHASRGSRFRHGAVLVDKHVVCAGVNSYKTHPLLRYKTQWPHLHAEQHALFKYGLDNCAGLDLYVCRILANNNMALSKPCNVCTGFIIEAGIRTVYYSVNKSRYGVFDVANRKHYTRPQYGDSYGIP